MLKSTKLLSLVIVAGVLLSSCAQRRFSDRRYTKSDRYYIEGAQFMHSLGLFFNAGLDRNVGYGYPVGGITYHPRVHLVKSRSAFSISFDLPLTVGLSHGRDFISYTPFEEVSGVAPKPKFGVTVEVPVALGFNFGYGANKSATNTFGGFFNAGYAFSYIPHGVAIRFPKYNTSGNPIPGQYDYAMPIGHGPRVQFGFRFKTGYVGWRLHGNFMYNLYQPSHLAGFGVAVNLGSWNY